eukprot:gene1494-2881_t
MDHDSTDNESGSTSVESRTSNVDSTGTNEVVSSYVKKNLTREDLQTSPTYSDMLGFVAIRNVCQVFLCISSVIQAQISDDSTREPSADPRVRYYDIPIHGYSGFQYKPDIDDFNSLIADDVDEGCEVKIKDIFTYIDLVFKSAKYPPECNIIALIYINRLSSSNNLIFTAINWRSIWLLCVVLAQKVFDDKPLRLSSFAQILPEFTPRILSGLERLTLELLNYDLGVTSTLYAKYYFELRGVFAEISNPMTIVQLKRLEARSFKETSRRRFTSFDDSGLENSMTMHRLQLQVECYTDKTVTVQNQNQIQSHNHSHNHTTLICKTASEIDSNSITNPPSSPSPIYEVLSCN